MSPSPLEVVFSCSICQTSLVQLSQKYPPQDGIRQHAGAESGTIPKLWLTSCAHIICRDCLKNGGEYKFVILCARNACLLSFQARPSTRQILCQRPLVPYVHWKKKTQVIKSCSRSTIRTMHNSMARYRRTTSNFHQLVSEITILGCKRYV